MINIEAKHNNTVHETNKKLTVCVVSQLEGRSMLEGVSVLGFFSKNGLILRITGPSGQVVLEFSSNAVNRILASGVGSEFHGHRMTGHILGSHPAMVGNLFRDLGIVVTPECVQVLESRLVIHKQPLQPELTTEPISQLTVPAADENTSQTSNVDKTQRPANRLNFKVRSTLIRDNALGQTHTS